MHIFFSGISGAAIGPLALIARQAGYTVSGSDKQDSNYMQYLREHGVDSIYVGQTAEAIARVHAANPIDWYVYSSAVAIENPDHPEFGFCRNNNIIMTKRAELLNKIMFDKNLKMIAVAGTHGKTTTTAMVVWLFKQLGVPLSYSVGAKLSFGSMGELQPDSQYFAYECDEFDRNFLAFDPHISLIPGIDWDHPDIYPTREDYYQAFRQFISQSSQTVIWQSDAERISLGDSAQVLIAHESDELVQQITLPGSVNRLNAYLVALGASRLLGRPVAELLPLINKFPGVSRRFEQLAPNLYTDYAHTPRKIEGALQLAKEVAGNNVVVVYEGLHNTRQHFIKDELGHLFSDLKHLYVVPSYLAREDAQLKLLTPQDIIALTGHPERATAAQLNDALWNALNARRKNGDLVLCLTAGGGNSLDEWLRRRLDSN